MFCWLWALDMVYEKRRKILRLYFLKILRLYFLFDN